MPSVEDYYLNMAGIDTRYLLRADTTITLAAPRSSVMNDIKQKSYVLCFSGGLDSTVLLYKLIDEGYKVYCLSVNYGQFHVNELNYARTIIEDIERRGNSCEWKSLDLYQLGYTILGGSSQTDHRVRVPEGHYTDESMKATVVPNRNMILLSLATAWAISLKADCVAYAAHAGDYTIYPDCRNAFITAMRNSIQFCDWNPPVLMTPFTNITKAEIVRIGAKLNVPFEKTYSCYKGDNKHCARCGTCVERREAFQLAGVHDQTQYEE